MTTYAFGKDRHALIAFRETGSGHVASTCAELPRDTPAGAIQHLAQTLTWFTAQAWRTYTYPASAADEQEVNTEGWQREEDRKAFTTVVQL